MFRLRHDNFRQDDDSVLILRNLNDKVITFGDSGQKLFSSDVDDNYRQKSSILKHDED